MHLACLLIENLNCCSTKSHIFIIRVSLFRVLKSGAMSVENIQSDGTGNLSSSYNPNTTSDEHIDPYCEICVAEKKRRIAAVGLCKDCNTFVCQQCLNAHLKWPGMRKHKILQGDDLPRAQSEKAESRLLHANRNTQLVIVRASIVIIILILLQPYLHGRYFWYIMLTKTSSINVRRTDDWSICNINGMVINANGSLLVADNINKNVKSFTQNGTLLTSLTLSEYPYAIALMSSSTAVLSSSSILWYNRVQFLKVSDLSALSVQMSVPVDYWIISLAVCNNNLVIISNTNPVSVKMIGIYGHEIWSTSLDIGGQPLFQAPTHLTTQVIDGKTTVIVTDWGRATITLLDAENGELKKIIDVKRKGPMGIAVDNEGYVYMCFGKTLEISIWSTDFSQSRILLSTNQLQGYPRNIIYSHVTGEIFVSYTLSSTCIIDRFQVMG